MSATTSTVSNFVSAIASRRSIYPLAKGAVIPDEKLIPLVQEIVRQSPSSFNSQSSRVVSRGTDDETVKAILVNAFRSNPATHRSSF